MLTLYWKVKPGHQRELTAEAGSPMFYCYRDPHVYNTSSLELSSLIKEQLRRRTVDMQD